MPATRTDARNPSRPATPARLELIRTITHPLRAHLLDLLSTDGPTTAADLAAVVGRTRACIGYHLDVLERHGAVERVAAGPGAGRARVFRSTARRIIEDDEWASLPVSLRRDIVANDLRHIGRSSHAALQRGGFDAGDAHLSWAPIALDDEGRQEMAALLRETVDRALAIAAGVRQRDPEAGRQTRTELAILHFSRERGDDEGGDPQQDLRARIYALSDELGEVVPEDAPDWQRVADRAYELGALAQRYGAAAGSIG